MDNVQLSLFGRMSQEHSLATTVQTLKQFSASWQTAGVITWNGQSWMHSSSECPKGVEECSSSLSLILESPKDVMDKYSLSPKAAEGVLRRANHKEKVLPEVLLTALQQIANQ